MDPVEANVFTKAYLAHTKINKNVTYCNITMKYKGGIA